MSQRTICIPRNELEANRQTGRSLGLKLKCLGDAILARGEPVEFIDHLPHVQNNQAKRFGKDIIELAYKINLQGIEVIVDGHRVFVTATQQKGLKVL